MQTSFYCHRNQETVGPYTLEQLRSMWSSGHLTADTLYWADASSEWRPLRSLLDSPIPQSSAIPSAESKAPVNRSEQPLTPPLLPKASSSDSGRSRTNEQSPFTPKQISDDFGLSADNPVPTTSIPGSRRYLELMATPDFQRITYERLGSYDSKATPRPVDKYQIFDSAGRPIYSVFINIYAGKETERAPEGLQYWRPFKGLSETKEGKDLIAKLRKDPKVQAALAQQKKLAEAQNAFDTMIGQMTGATPAKSGCLLLLVSCSSILFVLPFLLLLSRLD